MENIEQQSLSGIALQHHELIPVLEKYSLDFCCRGKKTLAEACIEKKLNLTATIRNWNTITKLLEIYNL